MLNPNGLMLDYYERKNSLESFKNRVSGSQDIQSRSQRSSVIANVEPLRTTRKMSKSNNTRMLDYYEGLRQTEIPSNIRRSSLRPEDGDRKGRKLSMIVSNTQPVKAKYRKTSFAGYGETVIQEITPTVSSAPSRKISIDGRRSRRISRDANTIFASPYQSKALERCCEEDVDETPGSQLFINSVKIPGSQIRNPLQSNFLQHYLAVVALQRPNQAKKRKFGSHKRYWSHMEDKDNSGSRSDSLDGMSSESEDLEEVTERLNKEIQRCSKYYGVRSETMDSPTPMMSRDLGKVYEDLQRSSNLDWNFRRENKGDEFIEMPEEIVKKRIKNRENNLMAPFSF